MLSEDKFIIVNRLYNAGSVTAGEAAVLLTNTNPESIVFGPPACEEIFPLGVQHAVEEQIRKERKEQY